MPATLTADPLIEFAHRALPELNALLLPSATGGVGELWGAGVGTGTIDKLWGLDAEVYRPGVTKLLAGVQDPKRLRWAFKYANLGGFFQLLKLLPDAAELLPTNLIPTGQRTPLGAKRSLRLLPIILLSLRNYKLPDGATLMQQQVWAHLNATTPRLEEFLSVLLALAGGAAPAVRPGPTPRQVRRHERNFKRRAGRRFRGRRFSRR